MVAYNKQPGIFHVSSQARRSGNDAGVESTDIHQKLANGYDTRLHIFTNGWTTDSGQTDGSLLVQDYGRYQVQMDGKGALVRMLRRRLDVDEKHVIAVGDSAGDIGMFEEAAHAICFNPWDERPRRMRMK